MKLAAEVAGRDPATNLAVLRVDGLDTPALRAASPDALTAGQLLVSAARSPDGTPLTALVVLQSIEGPVRVWRGVAFERLLRLDGPLSSPYAGTPLITAGGEAAGVVTAGQLRTAGFAIPANRAWAVAAELGREGRISRGYLGLMCQPVRLSPVQPGAAGRACTGLGLTGWHISPR